MKTTKLMTTFLCALAMLATTSVVRVAQAQEKKESKPCCEATVEAGKKCKHECCVKAAEAGKVCEKCHPKKDEKKEK